MTYGAGGSTREKTLMIVDRIQREHNLTALAHLTCVNHTRDEVRALLEKIRALGCKNILALRGDPPGGGEFQPTPGGFEFSSQLVQFIRETGEFFHRRRRFSRRPHRQQRTANSPTGNI